MKCIKCSKSGVILHRTAPKGQKANWTCIKCIEKEEPELANNIKEDSDMGLLNIIEDWFQKEF